MELYRDRPQEEWPRDAEGGLVMSNAPLDLEKLLQGIPETHISTVEQHKQQHCKTGSGYTKLNPSARDIAITLSASPSPR